MLLPGGGQGVVALPQELMWRGGGGVEGRWRGERLGEGWRVGGGVKGWGRDGGLVEGRSMCGGKVETWLASGGKKT